MANKRAPFSSANRGMFSAHARRDPSAHTDPPVRGGGNAVTDKHMTKSAPKTGSHAGDGMSGGDGFAGADTRGL